jgi:hypothetical protein
VTQEALCRSALAVFLLVGLHGGAVGGGTAQAQQSSITEAVRNALVWWNGLPDSIDVSGVDPELQTAMREFRARMKAFQSRLRPPRDQSPELQEAFFMEQMLEQTAYALGAGPAAAAEAAVLATHVSPAYEWEGFSGGPLGEMDGADRYVGHYPQASIRPYALLLVAHRGICALDALRYELANDHRDRSRNLRRQAAARRRYERALAEAAVSQHPLVRFVAADLRRTPRCF